MNARIAAVDYFLPAGELTNEHLSVQFPEWTVDKIAAKTGIRTRHIANAAESEASLAVMAARALFDNNDIESSAIDFVLLCTQSSDLSSSAARTVQRQLGLRLGIAAIDINLGCSGYVYSLGLAKGLVESGVAKNVLLLTADTYSRYVNSADKSVRTLFGDGASASLIAAGAAESRHLYAFEYGTNGSGGNALIVPNGGRRPGQDIAPSSATDVRGLVSNGFDLFMDGPAIFNFTLSVVPTTVESILHKAGLGLDDVDLFVFHQANAFMLQHLRRKLGIPPERFFISLENSGNTVSSTIPIALSEAQKQGVLQPGMRVMLLGFGVGLSWGGLMVQW
ncbi:ketoacyl-ACP synthase III [Cryobacterium sinapicolor]|uniref:Ketoacyl-ACP synthase III n=1 Tax=Cryobacterium sinapicolor TaxID=1259236 RepID=A0ABY2IVL3_9MICO|nr:ketoacyl-ACP synthase III [Cryobacterium sinapicolor]